MGVGIGLLLAQFLSYLWGGYTAGRMARGSGTANGVLVPIAALVFVAILGTIIAAVTGAAAELDPSDVQQLPLPLSRLTDIGTAVGVGLLLAMLGGGALGGWLGARWHTELENRAPSLGMRLRPVSQDTVTLKVRMSDWLPPHGFAKIRCTVSSPVFSATRLST